MVETRKLLPAGLSFDLRDLFLAQVWAACRAFRMVIGLDYRTDDGEEYEEVLVFYRPNSAFRWCMAWRSVSEIVVQSSIGQRQHFTTLADALEAMSPAGQPQQRGAVKKIGAVTDLSAMSPAAVTAPKPVQITTARSAPAVERRRWRPATARN